MQPRLWTPAMCSSRGEGVRVWCGSSGVREGLWVRGGRFVAGAVGSLSWSGFVCGLRGQELEPTGLWQEAFASFLREDVVRWRTLIQDLGIKSEN